MSMTPLRDALRTFFLFIVGVLFFIAPLTACSQQIVQVRDSVIDERALVFPVNGKTRFSRVVNGRSFQQWPMQTHKGYQYAAYFDHERRLCLGRRALPAGDWKIIRFEDHRFSSNDSHNVAVVGIAKGDGTIHLCFDQHADEMHYRRSVKGLASDPESFAWDASLFGDVTDTLGSAGQVSKITYPRFFSAPNGNLMLYYRSHTSGNGNGMIQEYDAKTGDWTPNLGKFIARDIGVFRKGDKQSTLRCPYLNGIWYVGDRIHATWIWRDRFDRTSPSNNHSLCYAYSDDDGRTWHNSDGQRIGKTGAELIHLDSPGLRVAEIPTRARPRNQNGQYAYADGSVHVVLAHRAEAGRDVRYHHHWRDGQGAWHRQTLPFVGSRPTLVGDEAKRLLLIYCDIESDRFRIALGTPKGDGTSWTWEPIFVQRGFVAGSEGLIDYSRWEQERVLSAYCQEEPTGRGDTPTPLHVTDYRLEGIP